MNKISPIYIAFGANLSNPHETFREAVEQLETLGVDIIRMSGLWQSPAWPQGSDQPDYINAVAAAEYGGDAKGLLALLHKVEAEFGRVRSLKNAARPLDLDLIDFCGQVLDDETITIPHPRMMDRGFVLFPMSELTQEWTHPITSIAIEEAIARLPLADVAPMSRIGTLKR